ncbi:MAG: formyl transferase [Gammaproteobacteria bacterium]|nr:formyl transferase [Gammaproteobacteria bacterium]
MANALCQAAEVLAIVQETGSEWDMRKLFRILRPDNFFRKSWRWLRDRRRYYGNPEARYFFAEEASKLGQPELVNEVPYINHPDVVQLANKLKPDLIAVFGTSLIRGDLLQKGRLGIVNLHGGLSPQYRGADCTFWALFNKEPEKIGCTLHFIDAGIDTGRLIAHISPQVRPDDDELTLFWRSVKESANVYAELMRRLACGESLGAPQHDMGCLYQVKQRGLRHERKVEQMLAEGLLHGRELGLRIRWFPAE